MIKLVLLSSKAVRISRKQKSQQRLRRSWCITFACLL